jgi:hypothetical protein
MVEGEETLDPEMAAAEDFLVQVGAKFLKVVQAISHESSGELAVGHTDGASIMNQNFPQSAALVGGGGERLFD